MVELGLEGEGCGAVGEGGEVGGLPGLERRVVGGGGPDFGTGGWHWESEVVGGWGCGDDLLFGELGLVVVAGEGG